MKLFRTNSIILTALLLAISVQAKNPQAGTVQERVRHELAMLPYLNVFDDLSFRVDNGTVTLLGEVTQPVLKSDAEHAVKHVEGVSAVNNEIEVLPLSSFDSGIRMREYRTIFSYPPLQRYGMGAIPSIHIIVKNGHVTLKGVVNSQQDSQMAYMRANSVSGVFSVDNQLQVQR